MKALYLRTVTGKGSRIDISMFQSATSWMGSPLMLATNLGIEIERHGTTHRAFVPASAFEAQDGYIYLAVGHDRQWLAITELPGFEGLACEAHRTNAGRIADKVSLEKSCKDYKLVIDPETLTVDQEATRRLRGGQGVPDESG